MNIKCKCGKEISKNANQCKSCSNINRGSWGNHSEEIKKKHSEFMKEWHKNNEHPKGMLGKTNNWGHQTKENKQKHSEFMKEWLKNNPHPRGMLGKKRTEEYLKERSNMFSGEGNPNWQGGKNFEPYNKYFNNKFKRAIRKRDNQVCMLCGIHREKLKIALSIHHINYNKKLSIPQNCISLCNFCHGKTNFGRKYWTNMFQSILSDKYGYQYSTNEDIIMEVVEN